MLFVSGRVLAQSWGWDGFPAEVRTEPRRAGCIDGSWIKSKEERFSRGLAWEDAWGWVEGRAVSMGMKKRGHSGRPRQEHGRGMGLCWTGAKSLQSLEGQEVCSLFSEQWGVT